MKRLVFSMVLGVVSTGMSFLHSVPSNYAYVLARDNLLYRINQEDTSQVSSTLFDGGFGTPIGQMIISPSRSKMFVPGWRTIGLNTFPRLYVMDLASFTQTSAIRLMGTKVAAVGFGASQMIWGISQDCVIWSWDSTDARETLATPRGSIAGGVATGLFAISPDNNKLIIGYVDSGVSKIAICSISGLVFSVINFVVIFFNF